MPITSVISSASLTPVVHQTRISSPNPTSVITAAPFTPAAQAQADAINTGRLPNRGAVHHNEAPPGAHAPSITPHRGSKVDIKA